VLERVSEEEKGDSKEKRTLLSVEHEIPLKKESSMVTVDSIGEEGREKQRRRNFH
jgi:hypothetical protein